MDKKRLDILLVEKNLAPSRSKALQLIKDECVYVNQQLILKAGYMCNRKDEIQIQKMDVLEYVSRGGLKLKKAITYFHLDFKEKVILDIGASTGGFSDCSLKHRAKFVYALDVGSNQLDRSLRNHPKIKVYENTNFKDVDASYFDLNIDFITIDVSFISIKSIILKINDLFCDKIIIGLYKPQFEVGKQAIGKNGVVRDKNAHLKALNEFQEFLNHLGFCLCDMTYSPIKGAKGGNIEYLCLIQKQKIVPFNYKKVVEQAFKTLKEEEEIC